MLNTREYKNCSSWVPEDDGHVPTDAFVGGNDINNEPLYVGRVEHNGEMIPGKIVPSHGVCYIAYGGREHPYRHYDTLVGNVSDFVWLPASCGQLKPGALKGGETRDGEPLFIGRVKHEISWCLGRIHPSHSCLYIPFGGNEISYPSYEVLCIKPLALTQRA